MNKDPNEKVTHTAEELREIVQQWNPRPIKPSSTAMAKTIVWIIFFFFVLFLFAKWLFS